MKEAMEREPMHPYLYPHSVDNSTQNGTPKPKRNTNVLLAWGKESAALLVAIGSAVGLVLLLMIYDGQELPNWKWGLGLNAVVSFLVVLQRGMVMVIIVEVISNTKWSWFKHSRPLIHMAVIDEASRGPLGIFWLVRRVPSNFIALTAALVAFLSLGMGPLTQQAVESVPCQQMSFGSNASIPVAQSIPRLFFRYGAGLFNLDAQSVANMLSGMTNPSGTDWRIRAQCPTGTCTFPETHGITHSTMGMCSSCIDVSSKAKQGDGDSYKRSSYSLPDGQNITGQALQSWITVKTGELNWTRGMDQEFDSLTPSSFARFSVLSFTLTGCQANATQGVRAWSNSTCTPGIPGVRGITANVVASSCAVYPCIKNFHGAVSNGVLRESLVSTVPAPPFDPASLSSITNSIVVINDPCVAPDQTVYTSANLSKSPDNAPGTSPVLVSGRNVSVPTNCLFRMSGLHGRAFRLWFESYFSNSCYLYDQSDRVDSIICPRGDWYTNAFFNKGFASHTSISGVVKDLAEAATETFRQAGLDWEGVTPAAVKGDALRATVCAKIHRAWLLYPILIIVASAILLGTSVVLGFLENRSMNAIPAWKSSVLPLLWHGLGQVDEANKEDRPMSLKELEVRAANTHGRFGQANTQWGLVKEE